MDIKGLGNLTGLLGSLALLALLGAGEGAPEPEAGRTWTNSIGMKFAYIPPCPEGFVMGSPEDESAHIPDEVQHRVRLSRGLFLGIYEVTQGQWKAVMRENSGYLEGDENLPVDGVSWEDAVKFCRLLSQKEGRIYRLPTEAEWEYGCRAGTTTPFHTGQTISSDQANFDGESSDGDQPKGIHRKKRMAVGSFPPNAWGLHDMHGNLWEWCSDWYGPYSGQDVTDPAGPAEGSARVLRGGSWSNDRSLLRSAFRRRYAPQRRDGYSGFRVALDAP
jgi:formylglycine-generating enzyme